MPTFDSPLGRLQAAQTNQKVLSVPDEGFQEINQEDYQKTRTSILKEEKRISSSTKERIEFLSNIGRASQDVLVDGVTFSLKTLKGAESREVMYIIGSRENKIEQFYESIVQTLARSIYKIDGQDIDLVLNSNKLSDYIDFVSNLDDSVQIFLYQHYADLDKKNKDKFSIKNDKEAEEVIDGIKK